MYVEYDGSSAEDDGNSADEYERTTTSQALVVKHRGRPSPANTKDTTSTRKRTIQHNSEDMARKKARLNSQTNDHKISKTIEHMTATFERFLHDIIQGIRSPTGHV